MSLKTSIHNCSFLCKSYTELVIKPGDVIYADPPYEDMVAYLNYQAANVPQVESDIKDLEAAVYFFSRTYHGGMGSNLFKAMSQTKHRPNPSHRGPADVSSAAHLLYSYLVGAFLEVA